MNISCLKRWLVCIFLLAQIFLFPGVRPVFSGPKKAVAIILTKSLKPYNEALLGFKEELSRSGLELSFYEFDLDAAKDNLDELINKISGLNPDLIFSIGTESTLFAKINLGKFPLVFSMVLDPIKNGIIESFAAPGKNITGVSLDVPIEAQFRKLKEALPGVRRVGVLYEVGNQKLLKEVNAAAQKTGFSIVAKPVRSEAEVPQMIEVLTKEADTVWAQPDALIYNVNSASHIILTLIKSKVPFMAFSFSYVKAGALMAMESDYDSIGKQSARIAKEVLAGKSPELIPVEAPENVSLAVNQRIADLIGVKITANILKESKNVYK